MSTRLSGHFNTILFLNRLFYFRRTLSVHVCLGHRFYRESNRPYRGIVAGNRILYEREIAVGRRKSDYRYLHLVCLLDRRVLVTAVYHKECGRKVGHIDESTETSNELVDFAVNHEAFELRVFLELA